MLCEVQQGAGEDEQNRYRVGILTLGDILDATFRPERALRGQLMSELSRCFGKRSGEHLHSLALHLHLHCKRVMKGHDPRLYKLKILLKNWGSQGLSCFLRRELKSFDGCDA